jgi:hypothetical protein
VRELQWIRPLRRRLCSYATSEGILTHATAALFGERGLDKMAIGLLVGVFTGRGRVSTLLPRIFRSRLRFGWTFRNRRHLLYHWVNHDRCGSRFDQTRGYGRTRKGPRQSGKFPTNGWLSRLLIALLLRHLTNLCTQEWAVHEEMSRVDAQGTTSFTVVDRVYGILRNRQRVLRPSGTEPVSCRRRDR